MLVNCPKCNFSQPKETYCAKCGIEMDAFRPKRQPLFTSIIKNPVTHIVVFLTIGFLGYSTYKSRLQFELIANSLNQTSMTIHNKKADVHQTQYKLASNNQPTQNIDHSSVNTNQNGESSPTPIQTHVVPNGTRLPSSIDSEATTAQPPINVHSGPWTLQVRYVELTAPNYQQWVNEAQSLDAYAEMGDFMMGKVVKDKKKFNKTIDNSTKVFPDLKMSKLFTGSLSAESGSDLTIGFKFNLIQDNSGAFQGDFDISEEDSAGTNKKQFTSSFEMKPNELLFIRSTVPHSSAKTDPSDSESLIIFDFQSSH
jgi:archaellum component FlaF (FlaF/FlaG flagellin family)